MSNNVREKLNTAASANHCTIELASAEAYWQVVNECWDDLLQIIAHHMDLEHPAYAVPGDNDSELTGRTILEELICLKTAQDPLIARYFAAAWCLASDAYAWSVPGWGKLCELCSEEWVLHGDTPDEAPDVAALTGQTF